MSRSRQDSHPEGIDLIDGGLPINNNSLIEIKFSCYFSNFHINEIICLLR